MPEAANAEIATVRKGLVAVAVAAGLGVSASAHDDDILVGRNDFTNELMLGYRFDISLYAEILVPGNPGWWNNDFASKRTSRATSKGIESPLIRERRSS